MSELRASGPVSRADLARSTGLAKQTVSTIVGQLIRDGVAREVGLGAPDRTGGRPATLLEYAADRAFVAGVELGVGRTRVVLADALGAPVGERDVVGLPVGRRTPPAAVLDGVLDALVELTDGPGAPGRLRSVGVSVTGLVQPSTGTCVLAPNLGWHNVPVAALLDERLRDRGWAVPVQVRGAAQAALIAEHREGAAAGVDDVVLLFEDEGVGAAAIEGGRLLEGVDGTAAELGHCTWPGGDLRCGCGRRGCVETLASGPALRRSIERASGRRIRLPAGTPTLEALAALEPSRIRDPAREAGEILGVAASWLVALTAPRLVLLSGALVGAPTAYRHGVEAVLGRPALDGGPAVRVADGALGHDASLRGAILLALDAARAAHLT
ncbi:ROK family transcriptional regulator [Myroides odoratimimus subsp. xuanwuensis]